MWILSICLTFLLVFGLYPDARGVNPLNNGVRLVYQCFSKIIWSVCVSFMIYACVASKGGLINRILSWPIWSPLSKLTYAAFLNHVTFLIYFYATQESPIHIGDSIMVKFKKKKFF